jgi:hypothetical protein
MSRMTYMRTWKSHQLTSHTWLGLNPQIGGPLSRIVGAIGLFFLLNNILTMKKYTKIYQNIPKIYDHILPKYTKINKKMSNNTRYILGLNFQYFSIRVLWLSCWFWSLIYNCYDLIEFSTFTKHRRGRDT